MSKVWRALALTPKGETRPEALREMESRLIHSFDFETETFQISRGVDNRRVDFFILSVLADDGYLPADLSPSSSPLVEYAELSLDLPEGVSRRALVTKLYQRVKYLVDSGYILRVNMEICLENSDLIGLSTGTYHALGTSVVLSPDTEITEEKVRYMLRDYPDPGFSALRS